MARLGYVPRSHRRTRSPSYRARLLEEEADEMEREIELLRQEPRRAPASAAVQRALQLQITYLETEVRRSRAAARRLRSPPPPPSDVKRSRQ